MAKFLFSVVVMLWLVGCAAPKEGTVETASESPATMSVTVADGQPNIIWSVSPDVVDGWLSMAALIVGGLMLLSLIVVAGPKLLKWMDNLLRRQTDVQRRERAKSQQILVQLPHVRASAFRGYQEALEKINADARATEADMQMIADYINTLARVTVAWVEKAEEIRSRLWVYIRLSDALAKRDVSTVMQFRGRLGLTDQTIADLLLPSLIGDDRAIKDLIAIIDQEIGLLRGRRDLHKQYAGRLIRSITDMRRRLEALRAKMVWAEATDPLVEALVGLQQAERRLSYIQIEGGGSDHSERAYLPSVDDSGFDLADLLDQADKAVSERV